MRRGVRVARDENIAPIQKMIGPLAPKNRYAKSYGKDTETLALLFISFIFGVLVTLFASSTGVGITELAGLQKLNATANWLQAMAI